MARESYVFRDGECIPKHQAPPLIQRLGRGPALLRDSVQPFRSQVDGKIYDSLSTYRQSISEANARTGREYEIVGNDYHHLTREQAPAVDDASIDRSLALSMEKLNG